MAGGDKAVEKSRRVWDKHSRTYDKSMAFWERKIFRGDREWVCGQAKGDVLEVAVGSGRNFSYYPEGIRLSGFDLSPAMVELARARAEELGLEVDLQVADAARLPYADASFDTVICTYSLCAIPDPVAAVREMHRVLRPGGQAVLSEHVRSGNPLVLAAQSLVSAVTVPLMNEHFLRTPDRTLRAAGFDLSHSERRNAGFVHRMLATKPA